MVYRQQGQTTEVVTDSRDGHGLLPIGVPEQAPPAVPITSEEGIAIKHKLWFISLPWEHIHPADAIPNALGSAQTLGDYPFPRSYN